MTTAEVRKAFIDYFHANGHKVVPSGPLVPVNDPTLLFTNAGMVQFKDVFLGRELSTYKRATTAQCCIRAGGKHNDLENVGYTARHHTFFEMLGNFSFGDYFKRAAINYAWEFLTKVLQLPPAKLLVTVYTQDTEAADLWLNEIGIDPMRFYRCGDQDNFWSMGDTGPCGPSTEIFYDHGPHIAGGPPGSANSEGDRYVEIWNLVFMQFNRDHDGKLYPLPAPAVDTGMGLERIAAVLQGVHNNYDIDIFKYLINFICELSPSIDPQNPAVKVIADHIRAAAFLIAENVLPGNESRSYVLRRIIRRAVRYGHKLALSAPFFYKLVQPLIKVMGDAYPQLARNKMRIEQVLMDEEGQFMRTIEHGLRLLQEAIHKLQNLSVPTKKIPGDVAFKLYDTYGFPLDLTIDLAAEQGFNVDSQGFNNFMRQQRSLSQSSQHFKRDQTIATEIKEPSQFVGYHKHTVKTVVLALENEGSKISKLTEGMRGRVILLTTPFYAESGGQVGDHGYLENAHCLFQVEDTQHIGCAIVHSGILRRGELAVGQLVRATIDLVRRNAIRLNHTATHLLHTALKKVIGPHVNQKGSLVADSYARFDFTHNNPLSIIQIAAIEDLVNQQILANRVVVTKLMDLEAAKKSGAVALFGEKYTEQVRVLTIGKFSQELCGGTHVSRTGEIGVCKITAESGVANGIRRIEFITGSYALKWLNNQLNILNDLTNKLQVTPQHAAEKLSHFLHANKQLDKKIIALEAELSAQKTSDLLTKVEVVNGINLLILHLEKKAGKILRTMLDQLKTKMQNYVIVLWTIENNKLNVVAGVSKNILGRAPTAKDLVKDLCGKGGGRDDLAEGGGDVPPNLAEKLLQIKSLLIKPIKPRL